MKSILTAVVAALVLGASPVWAKGGHGHGRDKHAEKQFKHANKHWAKHHRHVEERVVVHQYVNDRVVVHQHVHAGPAVIERHIVVPAAPAPGVHVVMPGMFVPF
jgi:hypothetical protein